MIPRASIGAAGLVSIAILLAGCGGTAPGTPTAARSAEPATQSPSEPSEPTVTTSESSGSGLTELDPCTLVSPDQLAGLGFTRPGEAQTALEAEMCTWAGSGRSVSVALDPSNSVDELNTGSATSVEEITVGSHDGRRVLETSGPGFCSIDIAVTESSSATVTGIDFDGTQLACDTAMQVATIVEPKLP